MLARRKRWASIEGRSMLAEVLAPGHNSSGVAQMQLRHLGTDSLHDSPLEEAGFQLVILL